MQKLDNMYSEVNFAFDVDDLTAETVVQDLKILLRILAHHMAEKPNLEETVERISIQNTARPMRAKMKRALEKEFGTESVLWNQICRNRLNKTEMKISVIEDIMRAVAKKITSIVLPKVRRDAELCAEIVREMEGQIDPPDPDETDEEGRLIETYINTDILIRVLGM